MKDGYIRVAAASPEITPAACARNAEAIKPYLDRAEKDAAKLLVLPELCLTGYTLGDLFLQKTLLDAAENALGELLAASEKTDAVILAGLPVRYINRLYSAAAVFQRGRLLGVVPKRHIPNYAEFYEKRHFTSGTGVKGTVRVAGQEAPFGADLLFCCSSLPDFTLGIEICEDLWVPAPPSSTLCQAGAAVIANLSASPAVTGKQAYLDGLIRLQSARCIAGYVYASAGRGESSTDLVFSGRLLAAEDGRTLAASDKNEDYIVSDLDTALLSAERRKMDTFLDEGVADEFRRISFDTRPENYRPLRRPLARHPFVPENNAENGERCREVLDIQCAGLARRLRHVHAKTAVVAVSGGLDSTLSLLVSHRAIKNFGLDCRIVAITMPGPGTTPRTKGNAEKLCEAIDAELKTVPISKAVEAHLNDIGHDDAHDVTFENAQARERMQVAMDVSNMTGGIVVGTGDMSELALGFTTYNGDHMSMYGVNCGVPKTLIRHLIQYVSDENAAKNSLLSETLADVLATPVSPELLPAKDGQITQETEQIVGPYELHDFFLYHFLRFGFPPEKILRLALQAFDGAYEPAFIKECLEKFLRRFFSAQFKRSCLPDGPKVGSVALSPRGDWRMPSDAACEEWLKRL